MSLKSFGQAYFEDSGFLARFWSKVETFGLRLKRLDYVFNFEKLSRLLKSSLHKKKNIIAGKRLIRKKTVISIIFVANIAALASVFVF